MRGEGRERGVREEMDMRTMRNSESLMGELRRMQKRE
jgi:hypothetical protein